MPIGSIGNNSYNNFSQRMARTGKADDTEKPEKPNNDKAPSYTAAPPSSSLTMDDFMELLAVQMQNQDISNPMSNSEMMGQLTSMATVQAMNTFTELSTTQYATGMIGQKVQVVEPRGKDDTSTDLKKKTGVVTGIDLVAMKIYLDNSDAVGYPIGNIMQVGTVPEPPEEKPEDPKPDQGLPDPDKSAAKGSKSINEDPAAGRALPQDKADALANVGTIPDDKRAALEAGNNLSNDKNTTYQRPVTGPGAAIASGYAASKPVIGPGAAR